jgi:hypothetical protein
VNTHARILKKAIQKSMNRWFREHADRFATDPAFNEIPTSDDTTAINEMLTEDTIIKSMPAIDDTTLAVDDTTVFYEMTTIILNEPDNEQIEIVAV